MRSWQISVCFFSLQWKERPCSTSADAISSTALFPFAYCLLHSTTTSPKRTLDNKLPHNEMKLSAASSIVALACLASLAVAMPAPSPTSCSHPAFHGDGKPPKECSTTAHDKRAEEYPCGSLEREWCSEGCPYPIVGRKPPCKGGDGAGCTSRGN